VLLLVVLLLRMHSSFCVLCIGHIFFSWYHKYIVLSMMCLLKQSSHISAWYVPSCMLPYPKFIVMVPHSFPFSSESSSILLHQSHVTSVVCSFAVVSSFQSCFIVMFSISLV